MVYIYILPSFGDFGSSLPITRTIIFSYETTWNDPKIPNSLPSVLAPPWKVGNFGRDGAVVQSRDSMPPNRRKKCREITNMIQHDD